MTKAEEYRAVVNGYRREAAAKTGDTWAGVELALYIIGLSFDAIDRKHEKEGE